MTGRDHAANPRPFEPAVAETDAALVARALDGSQDAYRALADRFTGPVFNLVLRLVRDHGVAQELTQDAFVKAFAALRQFDPACRFSPWILRIAQNTAIDYLRRIRPTTVSLAGDADSKGMASVLVDERERSPLEHAELADLRAALDWALSQLRPEYRRLVILRYQDDHSYDEIATSLRLPVGTVKSHLHRARHAMALLMEEAGWGPESPGETPSVKPGVGYDS
jgi:RNA polymerase sigma-70 factor, ECF subfamily